MSPTISPLSSFLHAIHRRHINARRKAGCICLEEQLHNTCVNTAELMTHLPGLLEPSRTQQEIMHNRTEPAAAG